jgi:peptidoglycan/LPS O-acetylase OafA/YrhL
MQAPRRRGVPLSAGRVIDQAGEKRSSAVESLRALAALAVLEGHVYGISHGYGAAVYATYPARILFGGGFGVFLFFALTGFLLYRPFARRDFAGGDSVRLGRYAANRAFRILPLYYVVLVAYILIADKGGSLGTWWRSLFLLENFFPHTLSQVDGVMWSLVVEVHFYLLLPLIAWALARLSARSPRRAAVALVVVGVAAAVVRIVMVTKAHPVDIRWEYSLPGTFVFFVPGMLLALVDARWTTLRSKITGLASHGSLWAAASVPFWLAVLYRYNLDLLLVPATFLTVGAIALPLRRGALHRFLEWRPLAALGVTSYSLYLLHFPIVNAFGTASWAPHGYLGLLVLCLVVCCALALVSYRVVEAPFLRLRRAWSAASASSNTSAAQIGATDDDAANGPDGPPGSPAAPTSAPEPAMSVSQADAATSADPADGADAPADASPASRAGARLDSLTGLRFLAAFAVLLYHLVGGYYLTPLGALRHVFLQGLVGVSFFFMLSGFVLTWSHRSRDSAANFYRRRLAKIGPLQVVTWALVFVILAALGTPPTKKHALASLVLVVPWIPKLSYHLPVNGPSWSLGCELFFYACFPLVLPILQRMRLSRRRLLLVALVLTVALVAVAAVPFTPDTPRQWVLYFFPPVRMLEFVAGALLALEVKEATFPRVGLGLASVLALGAYVADSWAPASFEPVAVTLVPFGLLIVACAQADADGRRSIWRSRAMVTLGTWSFALYMVQAAVFAIVGHEIRGRLSDLEAAVLAVGVVVVSVAASGLLYHAVERPLERWLRVVSIDSLRLPSPRQALHAARRRLVALRPASPLVWLGGLSALSVIGLAAVAEAVPAGSTHVVASALGGPAGTSGGPGSATTTVVGGGAAPGPNGTATGGGGATRPATAAAGTGGTTQSVAAALVWYRSYAEAQIATIEADAQSCEQEAGTPATAPVPHAAGASTSTGVAVGQPGAVTAATPDACAELTAASTSAADGATAPDAQVQHQWQSYLQDEVVVAEDGTAAVDNPTAGLQGQMAVAAEQAQQALASMRQLLGVND